MVKSVYIQAPMNYFYSNRTNTVFEQPKQIMTLPISWYTNIHIFYHRFGPKAFEGHHIRICNNFSAHRLCNLVSHFMQGSCKMEQLSNRCLVKMHKTCKELNNRHEYCCYTRMVVYYVKVDRSINHHYP